MARWNEQLDKCGVFRVAREDDGTIGNANFLVMRSELERIIDRSVVEQIQWNGSLFAAIEIINVKNTRSTIVDDQFLLMENAQGTRTNTGQHSNPLEILLRVNREAQVGFDLFLVILRRFDRHDERGLFIGRLNEFFFNDDDAQFRSIEMRFIRSQLTFDADGTRQDVGENDRFLHWTSVTSNATEGDLLTR